MIIVNHSSIATLDIQPFMANTLHDLPLKISNQ